MEEVEGLISTLRDLAHKRGKGSMDPIWDDIGELTAHLRGNKTMFPLEDAKRLARHWLEKSAN